MTSAEPSNASALPQPAEGTVQRIRFVAQAEPGQDVLLEFRDPASGKAVRLAGGTEPVGPTGENGIDILTVPRQPSEELGSSEELLNWVAAARSPGEAPPVAITVHGAQVIWAPSRGAVLAAPDRVTPFLLALVDFWHYESELRKLERETAASWAELEKDSPLAHEVTVYDPERFEAVGRRMAETLQRRVRLARIQPHLARPQPQMSLLANQLIERLREKAHVEARLESLAAQLEVFERVYEMNSQRIADFKAARQDRTLEWVIIVLLAAETLLLLADLLWTMGV